MSRYVNVRTQLRELPLLRQTLQGMGCRVQEGAQAHPLRGGRKVDLSVQTSFGTLGFVQGPDQTITASAMEEILRRDACKEFLGQVTQQYARRKVMAEAERAGYRLVEEAVEGDNTIRLVVRKW